MPTDALRLSADTANLERFREFTLSRMEQWELSPALVPKVELLLEELLVNVCSYAYGDGTGEVELVLSDGDDGALTLLIRDWGTPFDPLSAKEPDLTLGIEERGIGGLGVHFVRQMAREVGYRRNGDANELTLILDAPALPGD